MSYKKLLKQIATEYEIPKETMEALHVEFGKIVDYKTEELNAKIKDFQDKEDERELDSFGKFDDKQKKLLKTLIKSTRGDEESYTDALKRVSKEFGVEPSSEQGEEEVKQVKDLPTPPVVTTSIFGEEIAELEKKQAEEDAKNQDTSGLLIFGEE